MLARFPNNWSSMWTCLLSVNTALRTSIATFTSSAGAYLTLPYLAASSLTGTPMEEAAFTMLTQY